LKDGAKAAQGQFSSKRNLITAMPAVRGHPKARLRVL
jgi:hypothetical protein